MNRNSCVQWKALSWVWIFTSVFTPIKISDDTHGVGVGEQMACALGGIWVGLSQTARQPRGSLKEGEQDTLPSGALWGPP